MEPIQSSERKSLKKMIIQEIKQYIIDHELKAGDQLPTERKFTELFGVSRSVVREALSFLENTEIITVRQGHGAFLNETNFENLLDNFFFLWQINSGKMKEIVGLRALFESSAIDEIVKANRKEELNRLKELVDNSAGLTTPEEFRNADLAFHQELLKATGNELFIQMTNMITSYFFQVQHVQLTHEEYQAINKEHQEIVAALLAGDAERAKKLLTNHMKNTRA